MWTTSIRLGQRRPASPLEIPPGRHRFEFQYTGLSFVAPEKVRFKYRLKGFDSRMGGRREPSAPPIYNYMPPGDYTFQVIACNNDGVWNETGAASRSPCCRISGRPGGSGSGRAVRRCWRPARPVWFDTRRRMRRKLERAERQRAIERERARIAHDIHDDLGAHLTRITMLSESASASLDDPAPGGGRHPPDLRHGPRADARMDEIVWAVNPRHDTLESLANYLEKFAQDLLARRHPLPAGPAGATARLAPDLRSAAQSLPRRSRRRCTTPSNIPPRPKPMSGSAPGRVVRAGRSRTTAADSTRKSGAGPPRIPIVLLPGNGLENMTRRLAEIHGRCDLHSAPGQGTRVVFTVPLKAAVA